MEEIPKIQSDIRWQVKTSSELRELIKDNRYEINNLKDQNIKFTEQEKRVAQLTTEVHTLIQRFNAKNTANDMVFKEIEVAFEKNKKRFDMHEELINAKDDQIKRVEADINVR